MEKWDAVETPVDGPVDPRGSSRGRFAAGTPEDVAALYTWANLQGARYRDFSASRKRYREQVRAQAAEPSEVRDEGPTESKVVLTSVKESSAVSLEDTPLELIRAIQPDVLVKGGDYTIDTVVGAEDVMAAGGRVEIVPTVHGFSTTNIVNKLKG